MKKAIFFSLLLLFISACESTENEDWQRYEIKERVLLKPAMSFGDNPHLMLQLETEEQYSSSGYIIESYSKLEEKELSIFIWCVKIDMKGTYLDVISPAHAAFNISDLNGEYELTVASIDYIDKYKLIVRENSAFIEGDSTAHTKPVNTMWIR